MVDRLAHDLRTAFPDMQGFSPRNLKYMRAFAQAWPEAEFVQQAAARLPWFHLCTLIDKLKTREARDWYRWGSCGKGELLYFHWKTFLLPAAMAQYVVVHEMAHLHAPHHTPEFWRRVERAMPDYERRKAWLDARGIEVEGL